MNSSTERLLIDGPAGPIELAIDRPDRQPPGREPARETHALALIAHPHPLFGGTLDNKVVQTLARAFVHMGYITCRPNFRGVGKSGGVHDAGAGEAIDLLQVAEWLRGIDAGRWRDAPLALAGFSFGSFVQTHVAAALASAARPAERLCLVGTATSRWNVLPVPADTVVIHGEQDDTVPLTSVFDWARPQNLPVIVMPGADHFFHRRLSDLKSLIVSQWGTRLARDAAGLNSD